MSKQFQAFYWDCNCGSMTVMSAEGLEKLLLWIRQGLGGGAEMVSRERAVRHLRRGTCLGPQFTSSDRHPRNSDRHRTSPKFGHRSECIGGETVLGDWLDEKGVEIPNGG
jgi:hypothetical protein